MVNMSATSQLDMDIAALDAPGSSLLEETVLTTDLGSGMLSRVVFSLSSWLQLMMNLIL